MPYINQNERKKLEFHVGKVSQYFTALNPGELNYFFSKCIWEIFDRDPSYANANSLIGMLECVKCEFYRRKVMPYEVMKKKLNGDI